MTTERCTHDELFLSVDLVIIPSLASGSRSGRVIDLRVSITQHNDNMYLMKPMIYLDIDGVILANETNAANYANEFLQYIIKNYPVTWLTTHCMSNDPETAVTRLQNVLEPSTVALLSQIGGTSWSVLKTEAIDFTKPFLWFDDDCFPEERETLEQHGVLANWIEINLYEDVNQLQRYLQDLPEAVAPIASHV